MVLKRDATEQRVVIAVIDVSDSSEAFLENNLDISHGMIMRSVSGNAVETLQA